MNPLYRSLSIAALVCFSLAALPAQATFHFMQIHQVIGGVNGDTTAQAIQLRMRAAGQNLVANGRLRAWNAAGASPIIVSNLVSNVPNGSGGSTVLIASANFLSETSPPTTADFIMDNLIPASYLAAGSLTFENNAGTIIYWRLSWGGASYTGSNAGDTTNDADGNFGPPFAGPLPTAGTQAVRFQGAVAAPSTNNLADYALTAGDAVFTNNAGSSFTVMAAVSNDLVSVDSCVDHGVAGELCVPVGPCDVEPRDGSGFFSLNMTNPTSSATAEVDCGSGPIAGLVTDGNPLLVDFGVLPNGNCSVTLGGDANGSYDLVILRGDVDANSNVNTADITAIKPLLGTTPGVGTEFVDIDVNGSINTADITYVKPRLGNGVVCP
jgi:hypothetical protein